MVAKYVLGFFFFLPLILCGKAMLNEKGKVSRLHKNVCHPKRRTFANIVITITINNNYC